MKALRLFTQASAAALVLPFTLSALPSLAADPQPGPDSRPQPGVPKGEVLKFSFNQSRHFPGTVRNYWIYIPAQYSPDKPACLYVNQDGVQWSAPVVFDNLIHKKEMPVTIGVFVMHGRAQAADGATALDRFNRSLEYDGLGDRYARFVTEELLPDVEKRTASDGRRIRISKDPNDRAIGGSSSGAVAAWTAAWERPDQFRRVFSAIGTYVGLRGADRYPTLLRKYEPKPIRVFLQDGINDQNIYAGDWWEANQMMERALTFAGYEVAHAWGEGGHNGQHGTAIFPDAMRWLWKDWPKPVAFGKSRNGYLSQILLPGLGWEQVGTETEAWGLTAKADGVVSYQQGKGSGRRFEIGHDGQPVLIPFSRSAARSVSPLLRRVTAHDGRSFTLVPRKGSVGMEVVITDRSGKRLGSEQLSYSPGGITLSPDQTLLYIADERSHWVYSYQIAPDGSLRHGQQYYWLHAPDTSDHAGAGGITVDRDGRLYVASALGVQVCDQPGRVNCILPVPGPGSPELPVSEVCFGGKEFDTLYAIQGGTIYRRKLAIKGRQTFHAPNKPPVPGL